MKRHVPSMFENEPQRLWHLGKPAQEDDDTVDIPLENPSEPPPNEQEWIDHPPHYTKGGIEPIDFIEANKLGYHLGNAVKYIVRAPHKGKMEEDLKKAIWYLNRYLEKECRS